MSRTCTICRHVRRSEIDSALVGNESIRDIASRFEISRPALQRHKGAHLSGAVLEVRDKREIARAGELLNAANKSTADLLSQAEQLQRTAQGILDEAVSANQRGVALQAIREARECLRLQGQLLGELDQRPQIGIVIASPEWQSLRTLILNALADYPEAKAAIVRALGHEA